MFWALGNVFGVGSGDSYVFTMGYTPPYTFLKGWSPGWIVSEKYKY